MTEPSTHQPDEDRSTTIARLLAGAAGDRPPGEGGIAADELLPLVYDELRGLAAARLGREAPDQTLNATALVHEAYLRLVGDRDPGWNGRRHFFGAAALAMRRILVDRARRRARLKHGGGLRRQDVSLDDAALASDADDRTLLAVDDAVRRLEAADPRRARIVNLRFFAGLSNEQTARALGVSVGTVERDWRFIRAWLQVELERDGG